MKKIVEACINSMFIKINNFYNYDNAIWLINTLMLLPFYADSTSITKILISLIAGQCNI